ncbi:MAG: hypothetical protein ACYS91_18290, partial [Planctomycetota bacterium]
PACPNPASPPVLLYCSTVLLFKSSNSRDPAFFTSSFEIPCSIFDIPHYTEAISIRVISESVFYVKCIFTHF